MRRTIRLNESELKRMIAESVKRVINEGNRKGIPYKHFQENSYDKAAKIEWSLSDIQNKLEQLKGLYNDAYSDEFDRRIQDVYSFACDALELMDKYGLNEGGFNSDNYYIDDATSISINESDYDGYFDWAKNSGASDEEIEAAGKKHDERNKGNSFHGDKLAYRQHTNQMFKDRGENSERQKELKKATIKNQRNGWRF